MTPRAVSPCDQITWNCYAKSRAACKLENSPPKIANLIVHSTYEVSYIGNIRNNRYLECNSSEYSVESHSKRAKEYADRFIGRSKADSNNVYLYPHLQQSNILDLNFF